MQVSANLWLHLTDSALLNQPRTDLVGRALKQAANAGSLVVVSIGDFHFAVMHQGNLLYDCQAQA